jgi:HlyD family secretion protein
MKNKKRTRIIIILVIIAVIIVAVGVFAGMKGKTELVINTETVKTDSIQITVTATGEIQPVYKVDVGTQVSGIVEKLYVDFNSVVKKGDLLAELDKSTLLEQVNQSEASLSNAESEQKFAQQNYDRVKQLYENKAATQASYEEATNQLIQAKNSVVTAKSNLQKAQVNLSYSRIFSPISGVILNKEVEQGQTVAASFSTPTLFTIANDLTRMQVEAAVDEADIGEVKEGQTVTFTVDAFPDDIFYGIVKQVRLEPIETSNVITYTVIIDAPNNDLKLYPGMTASVSIIVKNQKGLVIPMEAAFLTLDEEILKSLKKQNIEVREIFKDKEALTESLKDISKKSIWIRTTTGMQQVMVEQGLNDGAKVLVKNGLKEGDKVVRSVTEVKKSNKNAKDSNKSFMMGPPQEKKR